MRALILSFLSPLGRLSAAGFWWRQLLLAPLFALGSYVYGLSAILTLCPLALYPVDRLDPALPASALCLPSFVSCSLGIIETEAAARELLMEHHFAAPPTLDVVAHAELFMAAGMGLLLLASWCSLALLLRRLLDTRARLWALLPCALLPTLMLLPEGDGRLAGTLPAAVFIALLLLPNVMCLLPSREERGAPGAQRVSGRRA